MTHLLYFLISRAIEIIITAIVVRAFLTWVPSLRSRYRQFSLVLEAITEPMLKPFRSVLPPRSTGGLDLSPVLAILALQVARALIRVILR